MWSLASVRRIYEKCHTCCFRAVAFTTKKKWLQFSFIIFVTLFPTTLVFRVEQSARCVCGSYVCVCVCVSGQQLSIEMTFDLDIWQLVHLYAVQSMSNSVFKVMGQSLRSQVEKSSQKENIFGCTCTLPGNRNTKALSAKKTDPNLKLQISNSGRCFLCLSSCLC